MVCNNPAYQNEIVDAGAFPHLINLLRNGTPRAKEITATVLSNLINCNEDNQKKIMEPGALSLLIDLLKNGTPEAKIITAKVILHLSMDIRNQNKIIDAGAVPCLIALYENGTEQCKELASDALYMLLFTIPTEELKEIVDKLINFPYFQKRFETLSYFLQLQ